MYDSYIDIAWLSISKTFVIIFLSVLLCFKILNRTLDKAFIFGAFVLALCLSVGDFYLRFIPDMYLIASIIVITAIFVFCIDKRTILLAINAAIFSYAITYVSLLILLMISALVMAFTGSVRYDLFVLGTMIIQSAIYVFAGKHIKFEKIFNVLNKKSFDIVGIIISAIVFISYATLSDSLHNAQALSVFVIAVISALLFISWVVQTRKRLLREAETARNIKKYVTAIDDLEIKLTEAKEANIEKAKINHQYGHKIAALRESISDFKKMMFTGELTMESADELANIDLRIKKLAGDFDNEREGVVSLPLPKTGVATIDAMFKYQRKEALDRSINFSLEVLGDIKDMIQKCIDESTLETLIADHIKDAIIACNESSTALHNIMVNIGDKNGFYHFSVTDTGIPFEIDTLLQLGKEPVTTHKETGGSGLGFMTTFEMMRKCRASLVITEYDAEMKSVTIWFNDHISYAIQSYRAEALREAADTDNHIIIEDLA